MIALLVDPAGGTKQVHIVYASEELHFPLLRSWPTTTSWKPTEPCLEPMRCDIYKLVRPIDSSDGSILIYEWVRTE